MHASYDKMPTVNNDFRHQTKLNGICPYFTMFPLDFPYAILRAHAARHEWVLDPFCGRGTTNYASRVLGLPSLGIDSSPVAVAISQAKLANTTPHAILRSAQRILQQSPAPHDIPTGPFWEWAFHPQVLYRLCQVREALLHDCRSQTRKALRGIMRGALHGPTQKTKPAYFSNQSPRTYAPKPGYAVTFWQQRNLHPTHVDLLDIIHTRATRYFAHETTTAVGHIMQQDSRNATIFGRMDAPVKWVITSPPYYGMRTYLPDQWLRMWFLGGKAEVDYSMEQQLAHSSPTTFATQLRQVWANVRTVCTPDAQLVIRFGGINNRSVDPLDVITQSLDHSGWRLTAITSAGCAAAGRRQALHIQRTPKAAREEYDVWAVCA